MKFLGQLARSVSFVVTDQWALESFRKKKLLPEGKYLLRDVAAEKKYNFSLADSLERSRTAPPLLTGKSVFATVSVVPMRADLSIIIECAGGTLLSTAPRSFDAETLIVSCAADESQWNKFTALGYAIHSNELLLTGILKQNLELATDKHVLCAPAAAAAAAAASAPAAVPSKRAPRK